MASGIDSSESHEKSDGPHHLSRTGVSEGEPGRALEFTHRYAELRANTGGGKSAAGAGYESNLLALLDIAVPAFSDWCAIDIADSNGVLRRLAIRHSGCDHSTHVSGHGECGAPALLERVPELAELTKRVLASGRTEAWPNGADPELPWCLVVSLRVNDLPFGTMTFVSDESRPGYGFSEIAAAEEVAWNTATTIERILLHQDARDAVRRTQRIASQLHQLIAASITVAGLRNEQDILVSLANSTRNVFDADVAIVSLESGPVAPLQVAARRGKGAAIVPAGDDSPFSDLPSSRHGGTAPWREDDWLIAPLLERRDHARGVVAIRRDSGSEFGSEDREVLTLLAQVASRALDAAELSRTIQNSEARWRVLVETAPVGIVEVDTAGRVRWWNRAASRLFSWPDYAETSDGAPPVFPDAALTRLNALWSDVLEGVATGGREFVDVEIGGRRRDLTASAALLPSATGEARSILTLVDDVTDQRELKAELRHAHRMEIRGQVASSVAHDFNNLLTLISGYAEILSQDLEADDRAFQMVKDIQATASRASMLTGQLQTIGRTMAPEPVVLDPTAAIESNAEVLERIVGIDVEIVWSLDAHSRNVRVDADQFEQMILNLALNARDAMPEGGRLEISVSPVAISADRALDLHVSAGEYVLISVADTGSGMDEDTRQRCFEPLFTTKGPFKGTGLGLAAARRLVEESGGAIRCRSEVGLGTTFEIFLPAVDEAAAEEPPSTDVVRPRGSATVLLAEDDEGLRRLMGQVLRRNGYQVLEADSGERASELARDFDGPIDLLLSDVVMNLMSGPDLAQSLQSVNPALRVLLVSGTADATVLQSLLPGTCAFLAKPFKPSELVDQIHELLARRA